MRIAIPYQRSKFVRGTIHADTNEPDKFTHQTTEEMSRLLDYCANRREALKHAPRDGLVHVAEIPVTIYEQAVREGWDNPDGWREWLNKPENACFRTWKGRV
jgi:hypothetical protein